jgi:hypothetical protein
MEYFIAHIFLTILLAYFLYRLYQVDRKKLLEKLDTLKVANHQLLLEDLDLKVKVDAWIAIYEKEMSATFRWEHEERLSRFLKEIFEEYEPPESLNYEWKELTKLAFNAAKIKLLGIGKSKDSK